jgi:hypothetical protein
MRRGSIGSFSAAGVIGAAAPRKRLQNAQIANASHQIRSRANRKRGVSARNPQIFARFSIGADGILRKSIENAFQPMGKAGVPGRFFRQLICIERISA